MSIANVALTDTFDTQRTRLNQSIVRGNQLEITLPSAFDKANTANTTAVSSYDSSNAANAFTVSSVAALSNRVNTVNTIAVSAYNFANTVNANVSSISITVAAAFSQANIAVTTSQSAFNLANNVNNSTQILTDAASVSWNVALGKVATLNLSSGVGVTRNIANPTGTRSGEIYILHIIQGDATARSISAWGSAFKWTAATAPPSSSGSGTRDIYSFICDGSNLYGSFIPDVR